MEFGYFTLSDNHYENNPRDANQFVSDIAAEALYADQLGMHSAWIGEHHFNSLGVLSCPDLVLAYIAARTKHIRLAPAVTVTPLHHPIRSPSNGDARSAQRGRVDFAAAALRLREYEPFHVSFKDNQASSKRAWKSSRSSGPPKVASRITASTINSTTCASRQAIQKPLPAYIARSRSLRSSSPPVSATA